MGNITDRVQLGDSCSQHKPPPTVLDLFAGFGGNSTGFEMAGLNVVCARDSWDVTAETYCRNHYSEIFTLNTNYI